MRWGQCYERSTQSVHTQRVCAVLRFKKQHQTNPTPKPQPNNSTLGPTKQKKKPKHHQKKTKHKKNPKNKTPGENSPQKTKTNKKTTKNETITWSLYIQRQIEGIWHPLKGRATQATTKTCNTGRKVSQRTRTGFP